MEPDEYGELLVALRTPGRGLVIEGPTGVGKTTALIKAVEELKLNDILILSARKRDDRELLLAALEMDDIGIVAIDDYHRLPDDLRERVADRMKILADEESANAKLVVLGINNAGSSLIRFARDLMSRLDIIRFGTSSDQKVSRLVSEGAAVLNADLPIVDIVASARGSFQIAQLLAQKCCTLSGILEQKRSRQVMKHPFSRILSDIVDAMAIHYTEIAIRFASGPRFNPEGRAPYLHLLKWLSEARDRSIRVSELINQYPELESSISAVIGRGHLADHIDSDPDFKALLHFDQRNKFLSAEDPKFHFYLSNLDWTHFAVRAGFLNIEFEDKYDFALSFASDRRDQAAYLAHQLASRELHVFFDSFEQERILAANVEEYLAPIYRSQATFIVCFLSPEYPNRVWTRFESRQFHARFGTETVIPVVTELTNRAAIFDETNNIGSFVIVDAQPLEPQLDDLADALCRKIAAMRRRPKLKSGEFYCSRCCLVLPVLSMAADRVNMCMECASSTRI
ncbi:TIR domain-containing protein [Mycolicibacterium brisbanense]|uniref:TIR domain-containing protein n=1 Tax=Mycolicibacterium brisbanense TaxID=146020 RepID=UPI0013F4E914|nr:TIR domain-containing protein [Mycolicibacterium brisbanense]MCV7156472.1 TIR domain-containing protein [Mycolicibacterium brisbanense]